MQISRFLVVDPQQRYTAGEALAHPFFQQYDVEEVRHFSPFRKFKVRLGTGVTQRPDSETGSHRSGKPSGGMGFPAKLGEIGSSGRLMDLGFGRRGQPGWRSFSKRYCAYFLVLPKGFSTEED